MHRCPPSRVNMSTRAVRGGAYAYKPTGAAGLGGTREPNPELAKRHSCDDFEGCLPGDVLPRELAERSTLLGAPTVTEDLTRRRFLVLSGASAAGAAALSASGCSSGHASRYASGYASACATGDAIGEADTAGKGFVSRPDLTPPLITVRRHGNVAGSRYIFLDAPYSGPGHGGAIILDSRGELVWLGPNTEIGRAHV